jgi:hypothetical protein
VTIEFHWNSILFGNVLVHADMDNEKEITLRLFRGDGKEMLNVPESINWVVESIAREKMDEVTIDKKYDALYREWVEENL